MLLHPLQCSQFTFFKQSSSSKFKKVHPLSLPRRSTIRNSLTNGGISQYLTEDTIKTTLAVLSFFGGSAFIGNQLKEEIKTTRSDANKNLNSLREDFKSELKLQRYETNAEMKSSREEFKKEMREQRDEINVEMKSSREEFKKEMQLQREELKSSLSEIRADIQFSNDRAIRRFEVLTNKIDENYKDTTRKYESLTNKIDENYKDTTSKILDTVRESNKLLVETQRLFLMKSQEDISKRQKGTT